MFPDVGSHGSWTHFEKALIPLLTAQLPVLSHAQSRPPFCVGLQGLGFMCVKSTHSGKAFNPCPLTAPSLHGFPLYMDMFCFSSFFLLAALSVAQRGTYSLFIGTYLGKGRNPIFLSNPYSLHWPLLLSALTCIFAFYSFLLFISSSCRGGISLNQYAFILFMLNQKI